MSRVTVPVKFSQSGSRIPAALEKIAHARPIGGSDLARTLGDHIAATQASHRNAATLAGEGWIKAARGKPVVVQFENPGC